MKNKTFLVFASLLIIMFCLHGCGTTISDSLGAPPELEYKEPTIIPLGAFIFKEYEDADKIQLYGAENCVEASAIIRVSTDDNQSLGEAVADGNGSFRIKIGNVPGKNTVLIRAKGLDKDWSAPIFYTLRLL